MTTSTWDETFGRRPWETETWTLGECNEVMGYVESDRQSVGYFGAQPGVTSTIASRGGYERARLACAAPEMARLLLKLERSGVDDRIGGWCIDCGAKPGREHDETCELDALLRKAGLR